MVARRISALILLTASVSLATAGGDVPWTRAALARVPVGKGDRTPERTTIHATNLDAFAVEIDRVSQRAPLPRKQWAALIVAIGSVETNFDTEVIAGRCKPWACDHGRAKGAFQNHKLRFTADLWPIADGNLAVQVDMADRTLRHTWGTCAKLGVPFPASVFRGYAGGGNHSCSWPAPREAERVAVYMRVMATKAAEASP